ncbi:rhomboid family intramembrane serine protease [Saccharophagus sp. K07]|jgi:GlpG protein|uniref:rhomboid family intramembrane serine protease n=1 Tax=Saccharophagus sp. K07 TaxID=2283636 RepID=UPI0016521A61|nr:rhomboid family intramembrane serine protease [Saccharophagus sp. K07]MBC6904797.1 rhomboid family intramembrane serine protease [Saccharophagus sp. K07]
MPMVKLCSFAPGQVLAPLFEQLDAQGVRYELRDANGVAELWVDDGHLESAAQVLDQLREKNPQPSQMSRAEIAKAFLRTWPISIVTIALGFAGFFLTEYRPEWIPGFTFTKITVFVTYLASSTFTETYWIHHEWWRLITPAFLHFGIWHVLFNSLAMWELGRRLEFVLPRSIFLVLLLATGVMANVVQYWLPGSAIFGGLSGVIFGLFGAIAVLYRRTASPILKLPKGLYILAAVSLVVLPVILEKTVSIHVANGAHIGGLVAGLAFGLLLPTRFVRDFGFQDSRT